MQGPWICNRSSGRQTPSMFWNPKANYLGHKSRPFVPIMSQIIPRPLSYFQKIYFNISAYVFKWFPLPRSPPVSLNKLQTSEPIVCKVNGEREKRPCIET